MDKQYLKSKLYSLLKEKLHDFDDDVDLIYDLFFKDMVNPPFIRLKSKKQINFDTSFLKSPICKKAHERNPYNFVFNVGKNMYHPGEKNIYLSIGTNRTPNKYMVSYEDFNEGYIKSIIAHELTHWLDDSLSEQLPLTKKFFNYEKEKKKKNLPIVYYDMKVKGRNVAASNIEINAVVNMIYQVYKKNKRIWDRITFSDLFNLIPGLGYIYNSLSKEDRKHWKFKIKQRLYRENILGKNMINT